MVMLNISFIMDPLKPQLLSVYYKIVQRPKLISPSDAGKYLGQCINFTYPHPMEQGLQNQKVAHFETGEFISEYGWQDIEITEKQNNTIEKTDP